MEQTKSATMLLFAVGVLLIAGCDRRDASADRRSDPPEAIRQTDSIAPRLQTEPPSTPAESVPEPVTAVRTTPADAPPDLIVFRPSDSRVEHDDERLKQAGILRYESTHLRLYTDIDAEAAKSLPPLMDRAYQAWVDYFGPLPPDPAGSVFQMTGYIMADRERFRAVGLLPEDLPDFQHGRHRGQEFWMDDQPFDYYRRHLMIHEGTHCFMTILPNARAPVWYMEGMAEWFGTHRTLSDGTTQFGVIPDDRERFAGHGRITSIADDITEGRSLSLMDVTQLRPRDFLKTSSYAWAWAACTFLESHPRYRERFRQLRQHRHDRRFRMVFAELFEPDLPELEVEWRLFTANLRYGYEIEPAAIEFRPGKTLIESETHHVQVSANRGWQSSGVQVEAGRFYRIESTGRFTLADAPKPWVSEPQGITFRYFNGMPLGVLLATVHDVAVPEAMLRVLPVGRERVFQAPRSGTLYLRLNDDWSQLSDNRGSVSVQVQDVTAAVP